MGRLDVRICEARNLPDTQWISKPDPYAVVKLENQKHKTAVMDNQINPKWEEVFKFTIADENSSQIKFELWNQNVLKDEFLGQYSLSLSGLERGVVRDEWYLLQKCKSNAELRIRLLATDFGALPATPPVGPQSVSGGPSTIASNAPPPGGAPMGAPPAAPPLQPQGAPSYPPPQQQQGGQYPPPQPQGGGYPPQGAPQYPPQGGPSYPPQQQSYPPQQQSYPPQQQSYPPQQPSYPPQQPGYPPQQPSYPPQQPGYPPQQPSYPPQQPGYPPQQQAQGYPPQGPNYGY